VKCSTDQCAKEEAGRFDRAGFVFNHARIEHVSSPIEHTINPFERASALISTGSVSDLVGHSIACALNEASRVYLGAQASLPAMSALARNIEDALPLKISHPTQRNL
jgi:hypothetical protein